MIAPLIQTGIAVDAATDTSPPNVLLITSEDNGPELGCYGDRFVHTPHLDRLAAQGVRFERAFVATASCSESRAALLTGLYPHQNGQIGLATHHYRQFDGVSNVVTRLKARGYRTGLIGKLHVNPASAFPFDDRPDGSQYNTFSRRDVRRVAAAAAEFISADKSPFFLMVNYADAHLPFLRQQAGLPDKPLEADDVKPLSWIGLDTPRLREQQANYYNCLMRMDEGVGQLLAALEEAGKAGNTLVIYLGDHGAQFPRGKLTSYESGLRVPLMIRFPGQIAERTVCGELVSTLDVVPTILEAVGAGPPTGRCPPLDLPGRSLLTLSGDGKETWRKYLFTEYHGHYPPIYFPQRTVRDERYKLVVNLLQDRPNPVAKLCSRLDQPPHPPYVSAAELAATTAPVREAYEAWYEAPPVELYDLQTDPHEWHNRADDPQLAEVRARLLDELHRWQQQTADPLADPEKLTQLTAEHDAIEKPYVRQQDFQWRYPEYLAAPPTDAKTSAKSERSSRSPNLILIVSDDQGYGDLGCFGSTTIKTPHIDRLAAEGARLTNFYAAAPICTPTRAALMTGCYATRVGLPTPLHVYDRIGLSSAEITLPELLHEQGYRTGLIGKWHLGHHPEFYPTRHGFDVYWGTPLGHMFRRPAVGKNADDASDLFLDNERAIPFPADEDLTEQLTRKAIEFIRDNKRRPFFLLLAHTMPHEPLAISERFAGKSNGGLYGDVIECIDWSTGEILKTLEEEGLADDSVVIFTSDNGPKPGHGSAGRLRGYKHEPYEGGVRVPCVAWARGRIPAGRTIDSIATIMDLYPTLARLAGADISRQQVYDGRDISPLLLGEEEIEPPHDEFFYFVRHGVLAGVRQERWKLLRQPGKLQLYDLQADPEESQNQADRRPEIVQRLTNRMKEFEAEMRHNERPAGSLE